MSHFSKQELYTNVVYLLALVHKRADSHQKRIAVPDIEFPIRNSTSLVRSTEENVSTYVSLQAGWLYVHGKHEKSRLSREWDDCIRVTELLLLQRHFLDILSSGNFLGPLFIIIIIYYHNTLILIVILILILILVITKNGRSWQMLSTLNPWCNLVPKNSYTENRYSCQHCDICARNATMFSWALYTFLYATLHINSIRVRLLST